MNASAAATKGSPPRAPLRQPIHFAAVRAVFRVGFFSSFLSPNNALSDRAADYYCRAIHSYNDDNMIFIRNSIFLRNLRLFVFQSETWRQKKNTSSGRRKKNTDHYSLLFKSKKKETNRAGTRVHTLYCDMI